MIITLDRGTTTCECGLKITSLDNVRPHLESEHKLPPSIIGAAMRALRSGATYKQVKI